MLKFKELFIIGQGKVALQCKKILANYFKQEVGFIQEKDKTKLDLLFNGLKDCLIISANNFYLFKDICVQNNTIINYHNALLPQHRGVNAHMWAIYDGDSKSGITWHKVGSKIDSGEIIVQKEIELDKSLNALKLLIKQQKLAVDSFQECLDLLTQGKFIAINEHDLSCLHKKDDLPNQGRLDLNLGQEKLSLFLRAMDNGTIKDNVYLNIDNKRYYLDDYTIKDNSIELKFGDITIIKG